MLVQNAINEIIEAENNYETEREKLIPSLNHSVLQSNINFLLMLNYRDKYRIASEIALNLSGWNSTPDIAIFPSLSVDFRHDIIKFEQTPLGVIEILSPTQNIEELTVKAEMYFLKGVKSYWLVIPTFENIYFFEDAYNYHIFTKKDVLKDSNLSIELDLKEVFKS